METCTNCGATLRSGAKFCTTCGTRLNESSPANSGWGQPQSEEQPDSGETRVFSAVKTDTTEGDSQSFANSQQSADRWTNAYSDSHKAASNGNDPASRFISALDDEVKPSHDAETNSTSDPESTWATPAFTPPAPVNWSYGAGDDDGDSKVEATSDTDDTWVAPSTWNTPTSGDDDAETTPADDEVASVDIEEAAIDSPEEHETDAAGFSDGGSTEVDYLSGDENVAVAEENSIAPDAARDRAIELVDELRRMVRMMSGGGTSDPGAAAMALTETSLNISDFGDVRDVLVDVKNDPRDIQALSRLAGKIDRIEALLNEHASLSDAIETAIKDLTG